MARIRIEPGGKILIAVIGVLALIFVYWKLRGLMPSSEEARKTSIEYHSLIQKESKVDSSAVFHRQLESKNVPSTPIRIFFEFNRAGINKNVYCIFDKIQEAVRARGEGKFEITVEGNADSIGPKWYNLILSKRRAERVADSLARRLGIPSSKIKIVANGSSKPANSNLTRAGRADNRRVEVLIY